MKKYIVCLFAIFIGFISVQATDFDLSSKNVILYNLNEEEVLYEKNSEEIVSIASLTKIATAIVALENIESLDEEITLTRSDFEGLVEAHASVAGFNPFEKVTYRDLLYGLLLPSGADAAQALTRSVAGNHDNFINLMNELAQKLNMNHTHFVNETGLEAENHYSSVADVLKLFKYALENEEFKTIITSKTYITSNGKHQFTSTVFKAVDAFSLDMGYLLGGKTGTTGKAGKCLASLASANDIDYILITTGANSGRTPNHLLDAKKVYEYYINNFQNVSLLNKGDLLLSLDTLYSPKEKINYYADEDIIKYLHNNYSLDDLSISYEGIEEVKPSTKVGDLLGTLDIKYQDELLKEINIYLNEDIPFSLILFLENNPSIIYGIVAFIFVSIFIIVIKNNRKKAIKKY